MGNALFSLFVPFAFWVLDPGTARAQENASTIAADCNLKPDDPVIDVDPIKCMTQAILHSKFPALQDDIKIGYRSFDERGYFLQTDIDNLFAGPRKRSYFIEYNPALFTAKPPASAKAIAGILAHELVHIQDYAERSVLRVVMLFIQATSVYERKTDKTAMDLGFSDGLMAYREWIYKQISPEEMALKKKNYYTPEEIQAYLDDGNKTNKVRVGK